MALCLGLVSSLCLRVALSEVYGPRADALSGMWWPDSPRLSSFNLVDQDGRTFTERALDGHWTLLFFGYTQCPDICPSTLALIDRACDALGDARRDLKVLFVSVDGARDTPEVLARYVRHFDPAFRGATAPMMELHLLTRQLAVDFTKVGGVGPGDYAYEHSSSIFIVAPDRRVVGALDPSLDAEALATRVRTIRQFIGARG